MRNKPIKHTVRVWRDGKITWEQDFPTAEKAHNEYQDIINNWLKCGVPGWKIKVTRYAQYEDEAVERLMAYEEVIA